MAKEKRKVALHELLAVEKSLGETATRVQKETTKTLDGKRGIFEGLVKSHSIFDDEMQDLVQATEYKEVVSTVDEQLDFLNNELSRYWDVILQKEEANQRAFADIIVDNKTIAKHVPAIVLLGLEKKLTSLIALYNAIPTLDAAKAWVPATGYAKDNVFVTKFHTENQHSVTTKEWVEVSPATKEHKAQLAEKMITTVIGKYKIDNYSGAVTSEQKAENFQRLTKLIRAVKAARQRANSIDVNTEITIGKDLLDYIVGK